MIATLHRAIRIKEDDFVNLRRKADEMGMSYTQLLIDSALERLPDAQQDAETRLEHLERRITRLEDLAYGSS